MRSLKDIEKELRSNPEYLKELISKNLVIENKVSKVGSAADIDSDIHTEYREELVRHVGELYGEDTIANIGTEGTFLIKKAIKSLCMVYSIPPAVANKVTKLLPKSIETGEVSLLDVIGPNGDRYEDARDFREATSSPEWKEILTSAAKIDGKISNVGQHACGVIMSSKPLNQVIPMTISKDKNHRVTQWTYPELEALGLIKMDFLGLDTVDIIMNSVANIRFMGKEAPSMLELIHGPMDDKKTYEMISRGETTGIFQLGGAGVKDLLRRMSPTSIDHIAATTALYRPGPMGMNSHTIYAERSSGREKVNYPIHKDFIGSPLEDILKVTYNLCVFQEQITQIANMICGWSIREGDDLRKAMGKKKMSLMLEMKPRFIKDGVSRGYSEEAMTALWDNIESFGQYAFNRSHSYAYAINAYQAAWLKANYPAEFMASLMEQNYGNKDKISDIIKEAKRMNLIVGGPSINSSIEKIIPTYRKDTGYDIIYGLASLKGVPLETAIGIVNERNKNGEFKSVKSFIDRIMKSGIPMRKNIYQNLCYAGAFDCLGVSRKAAAESYEILSKESKKSASHGANLFSIFSEDSNLSSETESDSIVNGTEFSYVEKLKKEAEIIGLYLSGHPLDRAKSSLPAHISNSSIENVLSKTSSSSPDYKTSHSLVAAITNIEIKRNKKSTSIIVVLDDGDNYIEARLDRDSVRRIEKYSTRELIKNKYLSGAKEISKDFISRLNYPVYALPPLEEFEVYKINLTAYRAHSENDVPRIVITDISKLPLSYEGYVPFRIRVNKRELLPRIRNTRIYKSMSSHSEKEKVNGFLSVLPKTLEEHYPGSSPLSISVLSNQNGYEPDGYYLDAFYAMSNNTAGKERPWPPAKSNSIDEKKYQIDAPEDIVFDMLDYKETGKNVDRNSPGMTSFIERFFGVEMYDKGSFDNSIIEDDSIKKG